MHPVGGSGASASPVHQVGQALVCVNGVWRVTALSLCERTSDVITSRAKSAGKGFPQPVLGTGHWVSMGSGYMPGVRVGSAAGWRACCGIDTHGENRICKSSSL